MQLRRLKRLRFSQLDASVVDSFVKAMPSGAVVGLHSLYFDRCSDLDDSTMHELAKHRLPELRTISFNGCRALTESGFKTLLDATPKLQVLDARGCDFFSDKVLLDAERGCKQLHTIILNGCENASQSAIQAVANARRCNHGACSLKVVTANEDLWSVLDKLQKSVCFCN